MLHENKFVTNFKEKAELFNTFFANQCTLLTNSSALPNNLAKLTNKLLDTVNVVPVHKKGDKQCLKIYRRISLSAANFLSVSFIVSFSPFFTDNNLISQTIQGLDLVTPVLGN